VSKCFFSIIFQHYIFYIRTFHGSKVYTPSCKWFTNDVLQNKIYSLSLNHENLNMRLSQKLDIWFSLTKGTNIL